MSYQSSYSRAHPKYNRDFYEQLNLKNSQDVQNYSARKGNLGVGISGVAGDIQEKPTNHFEHNSLYQ